MFWLIKDLSTELGSTTSGQFWTFPPLWFDGQFRCKHKHLFQNEGLRHKGAVKCLAMWDKAWALYSRTVWQSIWRCLGFPVGLTHGVRPGYQPLGSQMMCRELWKPSGSVAVSVFQPSHLLEICILNSMIGTWCWGWLWQPLKTWSKMNSLSHPLIWALKFCLIS